VYVYYRIDPAQAALARSRIDALLAAMAPHCGQSPRRMQRCDDASTWMETYLDIADLGAFTDALNTSCEALDCAAFVAGERHLECFALPGDELGI
jgi:hypothetical protein